MTKGFSDSWNIQTPESTTTNSLDLQSEPTTANSLDIEGSWDLQSIIDKEFGVNSHLPVGLFKRFSFRRKSSQSSRSASTQPITSSVRRGSRSSMPRSSSVDAAGSSIERQLVPAIERRCWSVGPRPKFPRTELRLLGRIEDEGEEQRGIETVGEEQMD